MANVHDFAAKTIDGDEQPMSSYSDKVMLIVNVASKCGFTPQYKGLEALYRKYKDEGLVVLGFPCNQFGAQEPGNEDEIMTFCTTHYDVTFPMFAKVDVNGPETHPLYEHMKKEKLGLGGSKSVKWNFTKFLVNKQGAVVARYAPQASPASLERDIKELL